MNKVETWSPSRRMLKGREALDQYVTLQDYRTLKEQIAGVTDIARKAFKEIDHSHIEMFVPNTLDRCRRVARLVLAKLEELES